MHSATECGIDAVAANSTLKCVAGKPLENCQKKILKLEQGVGLVIFTSTRKCNNTLQGFIFQLESHAWKTLPSSGKKMNRPKKSISICTASN